MTKRRTPNPWLESTKIVWRYQVAIRDQLFLKARNPSLTEHERCIMLDCFIGCKSVEEAVTAICLSRDISA